MRSSVKTLANLSPEEKEALDRSAQEAFVFEASAKIRVLMRMCDYLGLETIMIHLDAALTELEKLDPLVGYTRKTNTP